MQPLSHLRTSLSPQKATLSPLAVTPRPLPQALTPTNHVLYVDSSVPGISQKWDCTPCGLCVWCLSLSIVCSGSIHIVVCVRATHLFMAEPLSPFCSHPGLLTWPHHEAQSHFWAFTLSTPPSGPHSGLCSNTSSLCVPDDR